MSEFAQPVIFSMTVSLDGYIADADGAIDWSPMSDELFRFHTEQVAGLGHYVCGRRLYEAMLYWETAEQQDGVTDDHRSFAQIWRRLPKVVASHTLERPEGNYRLVREDVAGEVAALREQPGGGISVGGPTLASGLIRAGLVDEFRRFVSPIVLGGGQPYFPTLEQPLRTELVETRTFDNGVVFLRHRVIR